MFSRYISSAIVIFVFLIEIISCKMPAQQTARVDDGWNKLPEILSKIVPPKFPDKDFLITDFGAKGDGIEDCSMSIQLAIEKCNASGGGRVVIPKGIFLTGKIHLKSNVNLHISEGATLKFSTNPDKYLPVVYTRFEGVECMNYSPFIYAKDEQNIAITGKGTLDGQADETHWWPWKDSKKTSEKNQKEDVKKLNEMGEKGVPVSERIFGDGHYLRPNFIQPYNCKNILIDGIKIINSPMWEINPVLCENVTVQNVDIYSHGPNNDGCDPESSKYVLIKNCTFDTGDDCIAIKSGRNNDGRRVNVASENIIIQNCNMKDGHGGVVIGSEISGSCRNVYAENCIMNSPNLDRALRIKTNSVRGGIIENIYMRNIEVGEVREAVVLVSFQYQEGDAGNYTPIVRNIFVKNVNSKKSEYGLFFDCYKRSPVTNVFIDSCRFNGVEKPNFMNFTENIKFNRVFINDTLL